MDSQLARRTLSRRDFLAAGAAAAALPFAKRSAPLEGKYGPFKMGLQSYSLRGYKTSDGKLDVDTALAKTQELGLHYWESFNGHIAASTSPKEVAAIKKKLSDHGVELLGYGVIHFSKNRDESKKLFEFGKMIGLSYFSADPDPDAFDDLDKLTEEYKINIGIHPHGPGHRYDKLDVIHKAIKDHSTAIGICNDTGHLLRSREDPVRAVEVFKGRTYGVHLKDVKDATRFTILGEGDLKLVELFKALSNAKYPYTMALEYEEHEQSPMDDIRACLVSAEKAAAKI